MNHSLFQQGSSWITCPSRAGSIERECTSPGRWGSTDNSWMLVLFADSSSASAQLRMHPHMAYQLISTCIYPSHAINKQLAALRTAPAQTSARVVVKSNSSGSVVFDSGVVNTTRPELSNRAPMAELALQSDTVYTWTVRGFFLCVYVSVHSEFYY